MDKIILVRHGESEADSKGICRGKKDEWKNTLLTKENQEQNQTPGLENTVNNADNSDNKNIPNVGLSLPAIPPVPERKKGVKIELPEDEVVETYLNTKSLRKTAIIYHASHKTINRILDKKGVDVETNDRDYYFNQGQLVISGYLKSDQK